MWRVIKNTDRHLSQIMLFFFFFFFFVVVVVFLFCFNFTNSNVNDNMLTDVFVSSVAASHVLSPMFITYM